MTSAMPRAALVLGLLGLVPFVAFAAAVRTGLVLPADQARIGAVLYGVVILCFMGGAQWGLATAAPRPRPRAFIVSVAPALLAWASLALDARLSLLLLTGGFAALLAYDLWTVRQGEAPPWYGRLRIGLTGVVAACLLAAAL